MREHSYTLVDQEALLNPKSKLPPEFRFKDSRGLRGGDISIEELDMMDKFVLVLVAKYGDERDYTELYEEARDIMIARRYARWHPMAGQDVDSNGDPIYNSDGEPI